jgi:hypothetical protein
MRKPKSRSRLPATSFPNQKPDKEANVYYLDDFPEDIQRDVLYLAEKMNCSIDEVVSNLVRTFLQVIANPFTPTPPEFVLIIRRLFQERDLGEK